MSAPLETRVTEDRPWLNFDLHAPMRVPSWAINAPVFVTARHMLWRKQRTPDLALDRGIRPWPEGNCTRAGGAYAGLHTVREEAIGPAVLPGATHAGGQGRMQETAKDQRHHQKEAKDDI